MGEFSAISAWETIDNTNNILYVSEFVAPSAITHRALPFPAGVYNVDTLKTAMQTALHGTGKTAGFGTDVVTERAVLLVRIAELIR